MNNTPFNQEIFEQLKDMVAYNINSGLRPRYLYKYRRLNTGTIENVINSCLWFACPYQYNDPFDTQLEFNYSYTDDSIHEFAAMLFNEFKVHNPVYFEDVPDTKSLVDKLTSDSNYLHFITTSLIDNLIATTRVCCFSAERNNILMWSHYADNHKGICLEFDTLNDLDLFLISEPMRYVKEYPKLSFFNDMQAIVNTSLFTKSSEWQYEREFRVRVELNAEEKVSLLVETLKKKNNVAVKKYYNPQSLRRIIIGCDALQIGANEHEISQLEKFITEVSQLYPHVVFTIAEKRKQEFGVTTDKESSVNEILDVISFLRLAQKRRKEVFEPIFMELYEQNSLSTKI